MKLVLSVTCAAILLINFSCGKKGDDPIPQPPPPAKKVLLKKVINESDGLSYYRQFEYDSQDRIIKVIADSATKPGNTDIEFFYDAQNKLIKSIDYGNSNGPNEFVETRRYYYDAAGNCLADTAFNKDEIKTGFWDNAHTFDAQNRLIKTVTGNQTIIRYEYGAGKNPTSQYVKYFGLSDLNIKQFTLFDDKKSWTCDNKTIILYYRSYGSKYTNDLFPNNPVKYKEAIAINSTSVLEYANMEEVYQYNADNYPISRRVTEISQAGTRVVYEQKFEYIVKQ